MKKILLLSFMTCLMACLVSCDSILDEKVESQFAEDFMGTKSGVEAVLADAYGKVHNIRDVVKRSDMTTDILWQSGGGEQGTATPLINYVWDPSNQLEAIDWTNFWQVVRNANIVLYYAPTASGFSSETDRTRFLAETRFLRLWAYYYLYDQFGPVPIRESMDAPQNLAKPTDAEFTAFMDKEFTEIIEQIYPVGEEPAYGRINQGGAMGLAVNWYLNQHEWEKVVKLCNRVIDSGKYKLVDDYNAMFALENEHNSEFMLVFACLANVNTNNLLATTWPTDFKTGLDGGIDGVTNTQWDNYASNYRMYRSFYDSFEPGDTRKNRILTKYINKKGETVDLLADNTANSKGNIRGMKYPPDPAATGNGCGNDFPVVRYAEMLLAKAEALNEMDGPTQASIDLVNMIRRRAGLADISLADYAGDKAKLRHHIIDERKWEFWYEGKRRDDLLRIGEFISNAKERGIDAHDYNVLFPIPQSAIDSNPNLEQNDGY